MSQNAARAVEDSRRDMSRHEPSWCAGTAVTEYRLLNGKRSAVGTPDRERVERAESKRHREQKNQLLPSVPERRKPNQIAERQVGRHAVVRSRS